MTRELSLGISPCPNDTFMFHDLVHGLACVEVGDTDPRISWRTELLDIEALNLHALDETPRFDVTKLSLPALAHRVDHYSILAAGAALGRGCGPLVVCPETDTNLDSLDDLAGLTVAIPGDHTTAYLLLRIFAQNAFATTTLRFDDIMPAVASGTVDAGLIIHESRFTFRDHGLREVADLGTVWESATDLPLPLGIIAARRSLPGELVTAIEDSLRTSVTNAFADPERSRAWVREHAQEMDDSVCQEHIGLYVNEFSMDLGDVGRHAVDELLKRGRTAGHLPPGGTPWRR
jgi:1,4-dihydroxy-6-naphthoate synthase